MASQPTVAEQAQYLGFQIAGEEYAIGILRVREILEYDTLTKVPTTPPSIRGVINLRGSVVPVVDLAVKFGLSESVISKRTCIVVVEVNLDGERAVMGVLADAVSQVIDLPASEVEPPPPFGTRVRVDCLIGMGRAGRKFVLLLDIDKLLSLDELEMTRQEAGPTAAVPPEARRDGEPSPAERDQPVPPTEMGS
ncbi:MAG TPA: chemotaxis protein CheW [Vicinamibacteria bacterium]|jgi:purine-binding chemotaxis protein CheW|nr:chemotaxis protein CheW [Vicinamibacteria bacterium]